MIIYLDGRSLRKIGSFGVLPCNGVGLQIEWEKLFYQKILTLEKDAGFVVYSS